MTADIEQIRGEQLTRSQSIGWSLVAWLAIGVFWLIVTRRFHPTLALAVIVTSSLICAYAGAAYINHLFLVPRYWRVGQYEKYAAALLGTMVVLTSLALTVIRISYFKALGPDPDQTGIYVHFAIDFAGMAIHVGAAASIVCAARRVEKWQQALIHH